jgi:signal transduction histidine kinase
MAALDDETSRVDRVVLAGALVSVLGVLSVASHIPPALQRHSLASLVLTIVLPSFLGVLILWVGYRTAAGTLIEPVDAIRFAGWTGVGVVTFLLVSLWILVLDLTLGYPVPHWYLLTINIVSLGAVAGIVIGLYDARARERARELERREEELERQNKRLDEFAGLVSHDLRNPLNVATARLELAQDDCESDQLDQVGGALDRMEHLIQDLLEFARGGSQVSEPEEISIEDQAEQAWANVPTDRARLAVAGDRSVAADASRFKRLLENLFRNAVEHGGGAVTVRVGTFDGGFYVEDDGPGILEEERETVFQAGYSSDADGTGFGLAIVKEIVEAHGWEIRVTESQEGGARFEIAGVDFAE